jgi:hypothetical protein
MRISLQVAALASGMVGKNVIIEKRNKGDQNNEKNDRFRLRYRGHHDHRDYIDRGSGKTLIRMPARTRCFSRNRKIPVRAIWVCTGIFCLLFGL